MKRIISIITLLLVFTLPLFAQGEATAVFLGIAPGARSGGMGETGVAHANNANATFYNAALLAWQYDEEYGYGEKPFQANLMHAKWLPKFNFEDLYYDYLAARYYLEDFGMISASLTYLNLGENEWTDDNNNSLGTFTSNEMAFSVGYSFFLQENISLGTNLKYIYSNLAPSDIQVGQERGSGKASSFAVDLGVLWKPDFADRMLSFGMAVNNIGPAMSYVDQAQADPLPTQLRLGAAYDLFLDEYNQFVFTYETTRQLVYKEGSQADGVLEAMFYSTWFKNSAEDSWNQFTHAVGVEYGYSELFFVRGGYFYENENFGNRNFFTLGIGLAIDLLSFDFGYIYAVDDNNPLGETLRLSLGVAL
jgi:hypothetical protein